MPGPRSESKNTAFGRCGRPQRELSVIFIITSERDGIGTIVPISPGVN